MRLVIYGAQGIALGAYKAIKKIFPEREVECFLVTSMENNATILEGIPVRELANYMNGMTQEEKDEIEVLIGTPENVIPRIVDVLTAAGLHNFVELTSIRWSDMQKNAFLKSGEFMPLSAYLLGCHEALMDVYKIVYHKDKPLQTEFVNPNYITPLQVGAANTDIRVAALTDDVGDSISNRNGDYSELTGLYWIWKNRLKHVVDIDRSYIGLAHYRRLFDLSNDEMLRLVDNSIDVVLPYPMPYEPNIEAHHARYLTNQEWSGVLQALEELEPEYAKAFKDILKQEYLYNYNVILAKSKVLDKYCRWLFPLLFRIEEINNPDGTKKPNRYIGYIGETLETLYFMYNKDKLRIAHTGCRFLV